MSGGDHAHVQLKKFAFEAVQSQARWLEDNYITKWAVLRAVKRLRVEGDCSVKNMGSQNVSWGIKTLQDLNAIYVLRFSLALCPRDITGLIRMSLQSERIPPST